MCGIFGITISKNAHYRNPLLENTVIDLALFSEVRGKDSSGLAFRNENNKSINVIKAQLLISSLIKNRVVAEELRSSFNNFRNSFQKRYFHLHHQ